ncbi:MAG: YicC/YloC family endoribonuclease [Bacillota bacterium]
MKSMTGYGKAETDTGAGKITVEIRTVNSRFADISIRIPREFAALEEAVKKQIQHTVARGRVDVFINIVRCQDKPKKVTVDKELFVTYYNALRELGEILALDPVPFLSARMDQFIIEEEDTRDVEELLPLLSECVGRALDEVVRMRSREGAHLWVQMREMLNEAEGIVGRMAERAPEIPALYRDRLKKRLAEMNEFSLVDEERIAAEVAIFAERSDVTEELDRIGSHLDQMRELMHEDAAVGRKMDFLLQEVHREVNTIASKAADLQMSRMVVEMKSLLERLREQVQNIE